MRASVFLIAPLMLFLAGAAWAQSQQVTAEQLPPAVWQTIQKHANGRQPSRIEREETGGQITYEVKLPMGGGKERSMTVGADGTLISVEVTLEETPGPVQKTVAMLLNGGTVDGIDKTIDEGEAVYDVDFTNKAGQERSMSLAEDGTLLSIQVALEETSPEVQASINAETQGGKLGEIEKQIDDNAISYEVSFTNKAGAERMFTVNGAGKLKRRQVMAQDTPAPVQKTIQNRVGSGTIQRVMQNLGPISYEVEAVVDGKPTAFKIGAKGKLLGKQE